VWTRRSQRGRVSTEDDRSEVNGGFYFDVDIDEASKAAKLISEDAFN
jgi:hypothetical protein